MGTGSVDLLQLPDTSSTCKEGIQRTLHAYCKGLTKELAARNEKIMLLLSKCIPPAPSPFAIIEAPFTPPAKPRAPADALTLPVENATFALLRDQAPGELNAAWCNETPRDGENAVRGAIWYFFSWTRLGICVTEPEPNSAFRQQSCLVKRFNAQDFPLGSSSSLPLETCSPCN